MNEISFHELAGEIILPVFFSVNGDSLPALCGYSRDSMAIGFCRGSGDGKFEDFHALVYTPEPTKFIPVNLNNDREADFILLYRDAGTVDVFLSTGMNFGYARTTYHVNYYPENIALADLNNDGISDIISFGKLSTGFSFLSGMGNGKYHISQTLLSEIPISQFTPARLNGDEFTDIIVHDWLSGAELFYFGMGNLEFSEQKRIDPGDDIPAFFYGDWNGDKLTDFGMRPYSSAVAALFINDGLGSFSHSQTLTMKNPFTTAIVSPFSNSTYPDIVFLSQADGMMKSFYNESGRRFDEGVVFGIEKNYSSVVAADLNNDNLSDIVFFSANNRTYQIYWNARKSLLISDAKRHFSFATGMQPSGLASTDIDDDGFDDLVVVHSSSSTVGIHFRSHEYIYSGFIPIPSIPRATSLKLFSRVDSTSTFLLEHEKDSRVSILSIKNSSSAESKKFFSTTYAVATSPSPQIFISETMLQDTTIEFFVSSLARQSILSYYRQLSGRKFVERNFKTVIPSQIIAAAVCDINKDKRPDLIYIFKSNDSLRYTFGVTISDSLNKYSGRTTILGLQDSSVSNAYLYFDDLNGDNINDCILAASPADEIRVAIGKADGSFKNFQTAAGKIRVTDRDQLQLVDLNSDGITDFTVVNTVTSELFVFFGRGNGRFHPSQFLFDLPEKSSYHVGDCNGDGIIDITYTDQKRNCVSVYFGSSGKK